MENQDRTRNPGDQVGTQGGQENRDRQDQGGKSGARPSPSGVPNEGRGMAESQGRQAQSPRARGGEYRGGQQGQGGVPNPDDVDDPSPGSFRGSVSRGTHEGEAGDGPVDESDDGPREVAVKDDLRNPE